MCLELRITPARLLTEHIPAGDREWENARDLFARHNSRIFPSRPASQVRRALEESLNSTTPISLRKVVQQLGYRSVYPLRYRYPELCDRIQKKHGEVDSIPPQRGKRYARTTHKVARKALERAMRDSQHRSLSAICKEIGYRNDSSLYHRFPEHVRALIAKNREWRDQKDQRVQEVITKALHEEPVPTLRELAGRVGHHPHNLRSRFPELCAALVARRPERKRLERERIRKQMEAALEQNPAPPMQLVAESLRRSQAHLGIIFPDLYGKIKRRYIEYRKTVRSERRVQFLAQVRKAVIELCARGINPSRQHVMSAIENPSMKWTLVLGRTSLRLCAKWKLSHLLAPAGWHRAPAVNPIANSNLTSQFIAPPVRKHPLANIKSEASVGRRGQRMVPRPSPHAAPRLRVCARRPGSRYAAHSGLSRAS